MKYSFLYYLCPFIPIRKYRKKIRGKAKSKPFFEAVLASVDSNKWKSFKINAFHLGETVTFAQTYKHWWNGEMVIATKKYHLDIFKMLAPEVPVILCEEKIFFKETSEYKKHIFSFVLINDELERWNLTTRNHFFDNWQNYLGKNLKTQNYATPVISEDAKLSAIKKLGKMGLSLENLIFVAPEAQSLSPLPETFWSSVIDTAQKKKYQIFINKSKGGQYSHNRGSVFRRLSLQNDHRFAFRSNRFALYDKQTFADYLYRHAWQSYRYATEIHLKKISVLFKRCG